MPSPRFVARVIFHVAVICMLVYLLLDLFKPEVLMKTQNAANDIYRPIMVKLQGLPIHKVIPGILIGITGAVNACRVLVAYLYSMGAAWENFLQELHRGWPGIKIEVKLLARLLMPWFSVFKGIISNATGSTLGQFALVVAGLFLINNMIAFIGTIRILWGIVSYCIRLAWKTLTFILGLPGKMWAFIVDLF